MARAFPGTHTSYISLPDGGPTDITGQAVSAFAWVMRTGSNGSPGNGILGHHNFDGGANRTQYAIVTAGNSLQIRVYTQTVGDGVVLPVDTWTPIGFTKSAALLRSFKNGALMTSTAHTTAMPATAVPFYIGRDDYAGYDTGFPGRIAGVAVWADTLGDEEMLALHEGVSPLRIRPTSLRLYMPLFGVNSPEPDFSGNNPAATITGTVTAADHAPVSPPIWTPGGGGF